MDWTEIEGKFFEERVVPQACESELTVNENFIKSSSTYFKAACKAGPWVPDLKLDRILKQKYSNLCSLCDRPKLCSKLDKYWGRTGPLYCLTDGFGDVAWVRLDDTYLHFGMLSESIAVAKHEDYSLLCDDGSQLPLNSSNPCSWLDHPWPVVMSRRHAAVGIQKLIASLKSNTRSNWQQAFQQLLDANRLQVVPLSSVKIPEDYLESVTGFLSANSIIHCERALKLCTYSALANTKCIWISEAAKANGVKPTITCEEQSNIEKCMREVNIGNSDAVIIESDFLTLAARKYNLISILHEHVNTSSTTYNIVAAVSATSSIRTLEDLKGKKACFSQYEGAGWNTAIYTLKHYNLMPSICPYSAAIAHFFSGVCVTELNLRLPESYKLMNSCEGMKSVELNGDQGAMHCLRSGSGDVAFVSRSAVVTETDVKNWPQNSMEYAFICPPNNTQECSLSRTSAGQIMVKKNISKVTSLEIKTVLMYVSNIFGKHPRKLQQAFKIFATFDGYRNVLFHNEAEHLEDSFLSRSLSPNYEDILMDVGECSSCSNLQLAEYFCLLLTGITVLLVICI